MRPVLKLKFVSRLWPFFLFSFIFIAIFYKVFFYGLVPFPGDLLVSWFFPYNSGGWEGYSSWITRKEFIAADVVRQLYPWRILAMDLLKEGIMPLWNPYAFSGTPLFANIQSAVFYPLNMLFFLFQEKVAWTIYILLQPFLGWWGMYLFIRSLKLSKFAAFFAGLSYAFMGYSIIWLELGIIGHTAVWIPFALFGIKSFFETQKIWYVLLTVFALTSMLLAGHIQTAVYGFLFVSAFSFFTLPQKKLSSFLLLFSFFVVAIGFSAVQLVPSIELLHHAARNSQESSKVFHMFQVPVQHLLTLLAPDFFGNPSTNNFWGVNYIEFVLFVGVPTLLFACVGAFSFFKINETRFLLITIIVSILFALPTPFSDALHTFQIPVLGTSLPSRVLFLTQLSLVILSAFGVEAYVAGKKRLLLPVICVCGVYLLLWLSILLLPVINTSPELTTHLKIAMRNLILPTGIALAFFLLITLSRIFPEKYLLFLFPIFFLSACEYWYMANKFLPFSPQSFMYPEHQLVSQVQRIAQHDRVYGFYTARVETNLPTMWRVQSPEGYDPLYIKRYGELIASEKVGQYTHAIPRSDAQLSESMPGQASVNKHILLNLTGVRYILDKSDPEMIYPTERFTKVWEQGKWRLYENTTSMPRAAVYYKSELTDTKDELLKKIYTTPLHDTILVESDAPKLTATHAATPAVVQSYTAHEVKLTTTALADGMLLLTDSYYPGWNAFVDGKQARIHRVNYTFRGVAVPKGMHTIRFVYAPTSFYVGSFLSGATLVLFSGALYFYIARRKGKNS